MQTHVDMSAPYSYIRELKCFIFDIDGTVALATTPIPEAVDLILRLRRAGRRVMFYTNSPNRSHQEMMEYLGKMDVYVALEDTKVSTNFYLEKEEYLDFMEEHMDLLTARLNKRGYICDMKTTLRNSEEESMMQTIEKQMTNPMMLSMQAFDVRA